MRLHCLWLLTCAAALGLAPTIVVRAQQRGETLAWAPAPVNPNPWVAPNKPHWKLADLLASHRGQASWRETVVADELLHAVYAACHERLSATAAQLSAGR
jgi:hypothetical protein